MPLTITIPKFELFNDQTNEFINVKEHSLVLEHSLVSISKWEAKWNKPFLSKTPMSHAESVDYIRCMTMTQNIDPNVYLGVTNKIIDQVAAYIDSPMTATTFRADNQSRKSSKIVTSEVIYYWMIALNIPFECQRWHLNRLLTLIKVCNAESSPKKMSQKDIYKQNKALNAARKKKLNTKG